MPVATLPRTVLKLSGEGVRPWLDGLITNALSGPLTFAALLTPQGKIIADFFIQDDGGDLLVDTPDQMAAPLQKRLAMYTLREPISVDATEMAVHAVWDEDDAPGDTDPRHPTLGHRVIGGTHPGEGVEAYDAHRLRLGVPSSMFDFGSGVVFPADANMDLLNGVDFSKGCFVGQEVVSRMKRMTEVRKRMRGVILTEASPSAKDIKAGERTVGTLLHSRGLLGMALIRLDRLRAAETGTTLGGAPCEVMASVTGET